MKKFRDRHLQILVATDVAARGLDVNDLSHIINYNLPDELNAYTHRSGRTGRAGKEGVSISIIHLREQFQIKRLEKMVARKFRRRPVPTGDEISKVRVMNLGMRVRDYNADKGLVDNHIDELNTLLEHLPKEELIKRFVSIQLHRMLHFYREAPDLNADVGHRAQDRKQDRKDRRRNRDRYEPGKRKVKVGLVMNVGSLNGLTPEMLINMVKVANSEGRVDVGRINIVKKQAYFDVPGALAEGVVESFQRNYIDLDGRRVGVGLAGTGYKVKPRKDKPRKSKQRKPERGRGKQE